jgi:hypothetical protein
MGDATEPEARDRGADEREAARRSRSDSPDAEAVPVEAAEGRGLALGVAVGGALGLSLGLVIDNLALGLAVGLGLGVAIGGGFEHSELS